MQQDALYEIVFSPDRVAVGQCSPLANASRQRTRAMEGKPIFGISVGLIDCEGCKDILEDSSNVFGACDKTEVPASCPCVTVDDCPCDGDGRGGGSGGGTGNRQSCAGGNVTGGIQPISDVECNYHHNSVCTDNDPFNEDDDCYSSRRRVPPYPSAMRLNQMVPPSTETDRYHVDEMGEYRIGMRECVGSSSMGDRSLGSQTIRNTRLARWASFMDNEGAYPEMVVGLGKFDLRGKDISAYCQVSADASEKGSVHLGFPDADFYRHRWTDRFGIVNHSLTALKCDIVEADISDVACKLTATRNADNIHRSGGSEFDTADDVRTEVAQVYRFDEIPTDERSPALLGFSCYPGNGYPTSDSWY